MPSKLDALELSKTKTDALEKTNPVRVAADAFAQLHDELGHSVEGVAAFLGEAICDIRAGDEASRRRALDSLHVIISKSLAGTDGATHEDGNSYWVNAQIKESPATPFGSGEVAPRGQ